MAEKELAQRQYHLDYLRVFASISIILLHVVAQDWYSFEVTSTAWNFYNMCNGATRWGVPVFVMISGALFLPREILMKQKNGRGKACQSHGRVHSPAGSQVPQPRSHYAS